ncbi:MAG: dihydroneopterin aldolase, partial [Prevotella sp.]|nr:dihydroneopterin aldolase [Prevotella sp.]
NLLEHVAGRIGKRMLKTFSSAHSVTVAVTKLNPPIGAECRGARVVISHPRTHVPTNPRKEEI